MATRIVHISDLHFSAPKKDQPAALVASILAAEPDLIVVSGDLTRTGTRSEFQEASDFVRSLPAPKLVVPGNHDLPVPGLVERVFVPFSRFHEYFGDFPDFLETPDLLLVGFNSAVAMQLGLDWSLGKVTRKSLDRCIDVLKTRRGNRLGVTVCHHPLRPHAMDARRSKTEGGPEAFEELAAAGMDLLLHGHLHRTSLTCVIADKRRVCEVCASTALSDRERGGPAGYNIINVANRQWDLTTFGYIEGRYTARPMKTPV